MALNNLFWNNLHLNNASISNMYHHILIHFQWDNVIFFILFRYDIMTAIVNGPRTVTNYVDMIMSLVIRNGTVRIYFHTSVLIRAVPQYHHSILVDRFWATNRNNCINFNSPSPARRKKACTHKSGVITFKLDSRVYSITMRVWFGWLTPYN